MINSRSTTNILKKEKANHFLFHVLYGIYKLVVRGKL